MLSFLLLFFFFRKCWEYGVYTQTEKPASNGFLRPAIFRQDVFQLFLPPFPDLVITSPPVFHLVKLSSHTATLTPHPTIHCKITKNYLIDQFMVDFSPCRGFCWPVCFYYFLGNTVCTELCPSGQCNICFYAWKTIGQPQILITVFNLHMTGLFSDCSSPGSAINWVVLPLYPVWMPTPHWGQGPEGKK